MSSARQLLVTVGVIAALGTGCSSSGPTGASSNPPTIPPSTPQSSLSSSADAVQTYLDAVNALCDDLLPKIIRATHGGSVDVPVTQFLASWPAHRRLEKWFDGKLARIPVPPAAKDNAAKLAAYVRFANRLDAARVAAAHKSQAAYDKEIRAEANAENDPTVTARSAAGFNDSCSAR